VSHRASGACWIVDQRVISKSLDDGCVKLGDLKRQDVQVHVEARIAEQDDPETWH